MALLSACSSEEGSQESESGAAVSISRLWLPGTAETTNFTGVVGSLWNGSWIAAMALGIVVWGLIIWCIARYRRRPADTGLPAQLRYNVPMEILYTVVPIFVVSVLFYFTARDQAAIESRPADPDVNIEVVAKQWSWDINYLDAEVYDTGRQSPVGNKDINDIVPTVYLPAGQSVELTLRSRDVVHSFWVPAFNYKKDVIPGRTNYWAFTPQEEGSYVGKCAELCGQYHPQMLFNVEVVSPERYEDQLQALRDAGQTGQLPTNIGRILTGDREEDQIGTQPGAEHKY
ncbi:cytochrome c oxidase subunit II [Quadrisphaera sp. DSM 44207]|uniref:aa3-type cytochrome oxidase subunit II n=1 Tax=Quadrisphaera sp. DSM 44207 TaxID=1881057 RepID=UPI00087FB3CB|nr:cytochrome c oxidase subunit II [Quadrisphaera sp. DSM 44207]SDQ33031.1 cytochrome c oxidase subunit 2 [Quadrisphaera sp. DSM 44207]